VSRYRVVGVVANPQRPEVPATVREAVDWLRGRSLDVRCAPDLGRSLPIDLPAFAWADLARQVDLVLTFGGDGTILYAARHLAGQAIPIFGVNTGTLGFLTSSSRVSMLESFERLFDGEGAVEPHMTLRAEVERAAEARGSGASARRAAALGKDGVESGDGTFTALNDVVVHKGAVTARVLDLRLELDGEEVGTYVADGLILSTPLGSTGYALSAQGPLVVPTMQAIVATPICPHTLATRPLVLPAEADVRVTVIERQERAGLAVDGNLVAELDIGDAIRVTRSEHEVHLVRLPDRGFFRLLRSKLHWGGRTSET
jgi:NAD+ kinase